MESSNPKGDKKQIPFCTDQIRKDLDKMEKGISMLRDRLNPVLKPDELIGPKEEGAEDESMVPLADELRVIYRHIQAMVSVIDYMNDVLEL